MENNNQIEKETISRGKFLKDLGISSAALMAFYCMGTVTSCKSESTPSPAPTTGGTTPPTTATKVDFTLDLTMATNQKLKDAGAFLYVDNVIVANAKGVLIALSKVCTHEGTTVDYRPAENDIRCSNHGSLFQLDGKNKLGPATNPLKMYTTQLTGDKLRVFE
jgi:cytochrome b6-f complex iron-sulfur subunit